MKYSINIHFSDEPILFVNNYGDMINLDLSLPYNSNLEEILNKRNIIPMLKGVLKEYSDDEDFEDTINAVNTMLNNELNIIENIEYFTIDFNELAPQFIDNNPLLKQNKIYLEGNYSINHEDLDEVEELFGKYENIVLFIDGNDEEVSISEYKKTVNAIDEMVSRIRKYNLSPLEQTLFAYDLVRDRVYVKEEENESHTKSRDLSSALLGDKIVCVGYANIFDKVLSNLGINTMMYSIKDKDPNKPGHRRNIAHIQDKKYGVDGVYYFDTTWDSKKQVGDNNYLNSYRFFAKLKEDIEYYNHSLVDRTFEGFEESFVWQFEESFEQNGLKGVPKNMIKTINEVSQFVDGKDLINTLLVSKMPIDMLPEFIKNSFNFDNVMERLCEYRRLFFDEVIPVDTLIKTLYNVRKIEYYEEPEKYSLSTEMFKKVIINSSWFLEQSFLDNFGDLDLDGEINMNEILNCLDNYLSENNLDRDIERIRLTSTLRNVLNSQRKK